jgi:osmotically-inducible protein OsmY
VGEQQEEVEQRIRTQIGEDPRTMDMPRVNVEVNDGIAELRGEAPSEEAKAAAGEIASGVEGVREVRNLITVS